MLIAHKEELTERQQSVREHCDNVELLARAYGSKIGVDAAAGLIGKVHDMGKCKQEFQNYILGISNAKRGEINHAACGARYLEETYALGEYGGNLPVQMLALAVESHHAGLIDCISTKGENTYQNGVWKDAEAQFQAAVQTYHQECAGEAELKQAFEQAAVQLEEKMREIQHMGAFGKHLLEKYLFSCLIDADRYDTYCFAAGIEPKPDFKPDRAFWRTYLEWLEAALEDMAKQQPKSEGEQKVRQLRQEISDSCRAWAKREPGVYQLYVPTGGGKTLSSLRYALAHCMEYEKEHIFYVIPYQTIIEQTVQEIRDKLQEDDETIILEHHANVIHGAEEEKTEEEIQKQYERLTERWTSPVIVTTMVQFLNTLFAGKTRNLRRMHQLANSVIIFDEIQSIPVKCIHMFNEAVNFLSEVCHATVVLCTATQPKLEGVEEHSLRLAQPAQIVEDYLDKFRQLSRVKLVDTTRWKPTMTYEDAADFVWEKHQALPHVLVVVNTKAAAKEIYQRLQEKNQMLPAEEAADIILLTTSLCAADRLERLDAIKKTPAGKKLICVSTQLIECGVDLSFDCVVRSLAGLDNAAQSAGRCNRHGEMGCREVYLVKLCEEKLNKLPDIQKAQESCERVLREFAKKPEYFGNDLLSPKAIACYYHYYYHERKNEMGYWAEKSDRETLFDMLSDNETAWRAYTHESKQQTLPAMRQAFAEAGAKFHVIEDNTTTVLVPFKKGKEYILQLNGQCSPEEAVKLARRAQRYTVQIYPGDRNELEKKGALYQLNCGNIWALHDEYYDSELGVVQDAALKEMIF